MTDAVTAAALLDALEDLGVTHLVGVPDNGSAALFARAVDHPTIDMLTATREGEAVSIASGIWLGGGNPAVTIQNTGLLESGDGLRGTAYRMGVPLLMLVGVRGHAKMIAHQDEIEAERRGGGLSPEMLQRPDVDSVALVTEATLEAWAIPFWVYQSDADVPVIEEAWAHAQQHRQPVAVLVTRWME